MLGTKTAYPEISLLLSLYPKCKPSSNPINITLQIFVKSSYFISITAILNQDSIISSLNCSKAQLNSTQSGLWTKHCFTNYYYNVKTKREHLEIFVVIWHCHNIHFIVTKVPGCIRNKNKTKQVLNQIILSSTGPTGLGFYSCLPQSVLHKGAKCF